MESVTVLVHAKDPLTRMVLGSHLDAQPGLGTVPDDRPDAANVVVCVADSLSVEVISLLRRMKAYSGAPVVLIVNEIERADLMTAVECNVVAVLPRSVASGERITDAVRTAAVGGGMLPTDVLGDLLKQVRHVQREVLTPQGLHSSGLTPREIDVLRLMSDGFDTAEIAVKLSFSERAVKRVIFGMTNRLKLRNRPHAVAYALRAGVI
ncbi:helix-turn-helix transcriptional regulator [Actinokineospora pegani]|uniref:helix-turn-helix transcriptional regulator n=1 Tax=Actinokineospora pegani TaxID=2654637 RepID=UPI001F37E07D|nr:LuxR C-terminal-related transcriptional regulator [Actinokineospora pegani]